MKTTFWLLFQLLFVSPFLQAQVQTLVPDLTDRNSWLVHNREAQFGPEVQLNAQAGDGILWLNDFEFSNGTIELDIKGKNDPGKSFVGLAFHGQDNETYDAIYFRPFNFKNPDRNGYSVQYISHPEHTWNTLREQYPEQYENPVQPVPDPDNWFHATIMVNYPSVKVYVNGNRQTSLEIEQLSNRKSGKIGFWVGNNSAGSFRNLKIHHKRENIGRK